MFVTSLFLSSGRNRRISERMSRSALLKDLKTSEGYGNDVVVIIISIISCVSISSYASKTLTLMNKRSPI
ncbi:hypothetical protein RB195_011940 [Necator americanus]|uniref:Uncharacterized protein n=1 Tax=Necator americanus TaxID=51031 RepID=A0ABR1D4Q2_NECAM